MQIGLICVFWLVGETASRLLSLPLPGGVVGMLLVLALLLTHRVKLISFQRGARWLLAEMLLFFVPLVLAVLDKPSYFGALGAKILAVIVSGTAVVMAVTALVVDVFFRWSVTRAGSE